MMTVEEMRIRKTQLRYTYSELAELAGLPVSTVQKVLTGVTAAPRTSTMQALERVLEVKGPEKKDVRNGMADLYKMPLSGRAPMADLVREAMPAYGTDPVRGTVPAYRMDSVREAAPVNKTDPARETGAVLGADPACRAFDGLQGPYTIREYDALPQEQRAELINGFLFRMEAPSALHQELLMELAFYFKEFQKKNRPDCRVFPAPFDVQLDKNDLTVLQPDLSIICDRSKIHHRGCYGAPDFIVEIISDSTRTKDMYLKLLKYKEAGVREYWIVDPVRSSVLVYNYEDSDRVAVYGMEAKVPVGISGGELVVDFAMIMEDLGYLTKKVKDS